MDGKLFTPIRIGTMECRNRLVRSATYTYAGQKDGTISQKQIDLHARLANHGVGCIITEHFCVSYPDGLAADDQCGLYDDRFISGLSTLVEAVERHDCRLIVQLGHSGAQNKSSAMNGLLLLAPSPIEVLPGRPARAMTLDEIRALPDAYAKAAARAKQAGATGVQLHCAHDYLMSAFLTPSLNHREDSYGGTRENRLRLPLETLMAIRSAVGTDYPVFIKINATVAEDPGTYLDDLIYYLDALYREGLTAAELSGADFTKHRFGDGVYYLTQAQRIKERTACPLIVTGGMRSPFELEEALSGGADMVGISRPLICEPDIVREWSAGNMIRSACVSCNRCFKLPRESGQYCIRHQTKML